MKKRKEIGLMRLIVIAWITYALFLCGFALTTRYKETIVNTYNKYFDKYYAIAMDYYEEAKAEIIREIELAQKNSI